MADRPAEDHAPWHRSGLTGLRVAAGILFYVASVALLIEAVRRDWLEGWSRGLTATDIFTAIALGVLARLFMALCWSRMLARPCGSSAPGDTRAWALYAVTALGKYIPGKVLTVAIRTYLSRRLDVPLPQALEASAREPFLNIGAVTALGGLLLLGTTTGWGSALLALGLAIGIAALRLDTSRFWRLLPSVRPQATGTPGPLPRRSGWISLLLAFCSALAQGACVLVVAAAQLPLPGIQGAMSVVGTFMISHVAGVLVFLSPAGLGVREGVQATLLAGQFSPGLLAGFLVSCRLIDLAADATFALGGFARLVARRLSPAGMGGRKGHA